MKGQHTYYSPTAASAKLGVHMQTLRRWAEAGVIEYVLTPGGHYRYDVDGFIDSCKAKEAAKPPKKVNGDSDLQNTSQDS